MDLDIQLKLKLFDQVIKPVCPCDSEIWAPYLSSKYEGKYSSECKFDEMHVEKLHISCCRTILGVKRGTSNAAIRGELSIYPLYRRYM